MRYVAPLIVALICAPVAHAQGGSFESFDAGLARIAGTFARTIEGRTIAVFEFPDLESRITNLGRLVSEQLTTELVQQSQGRASVVERRQVIQVLTELNLLNTDLTSSQVARVGRQLGADAIVLGSTTLLGTQVVVNARLVDVSAGRVLAADRMSIVGSEPLLALATQGINAPTLMPSQGPHAPTAAPPSRVAQHASVGAVAVEMIGCSGRGTVVTCDFRFRNDGSDANLTLTDGEPSRIIDDSGTQFELSAVELARERSHWVQKTLVSGVQTPGRLVFSPVDASVRTIALMEVGVWLNQEQSVLQFRNVPISR